MNENVKVLITTESVCDLPEELIEELPIAVIPYYVVTDEGRFADGIEIGSEDLLRYISDKGKYGLSQEPEVSEIKAFFEERLQSANYIIHITMGQNTSVGYKNALEASKDKTNITVVDSGLISTGLGLVVLKAAELVNQGKSVDYIVSFIKQYAKNISCSFVMKDMEFLEKGGRLSHTTRRLYEGMLANPLMKMKNGAIHFGGFYVGDYKSVISRYIKSQINMISKDSEDPVFVAHTGVDDAILEEVNELIKEILPKARVYYVMASPAITCNCGAGTIGFIYSGNKYTTYSKENTSVVEKLKLKVLEIEDTILNDNFSIDQRLLNLILALGWMGGIVSAIISMFLGEYIGALIVIALLAVVMYCLKLSVFYQKPDAAGVIACIVTNMIVFPILFFISGGVKSGVPIWFVLGLVFDWLILRGKTCYIVFTINAVFLLLCIVIGDIAPWLVKEVTDYYTKYDIMQTLIVVSVVIGVIYKYQKYLHDTQRKELKLREEELLKLNSTKDIFLANMSHEIRTPINGIIGMNTMLMRECKDPNLLEYSVNIQSASQVLLSLINDILDVSKVEAGKLEILPSEYDVFSLINDCYQIAHSRSVNKGLDFEIDMDPEIPSVLYGDEIRIKQILNNILSNAVKYTKEGYVKFSIGVDNISDAYVSIRAVIEDTGIGIREEDKDKIFQSFSRVDEKKNRGIEGTGLGLTLTKNLVSMMNGTLTVDSIYGHGSTFTVTLPQRIVDRAPIGDFNQKYKDHLSSADSKYDIVYAPDARILVVDDVSMNLLVAKGLMKQNGMTVDTCESGAEAVQLVLHSKYDIIFLDHLMPEMDGIECLHRIKSLRFNPNEDTPIIVLTANAVAGVRDEYLRTGFTDYLSKPIKERDLNDILNTYLPEDKKKKKEDKEITEDKNTKENEILETNEITEDKNIKETITEDDITKDKNAGENNTELSIDKIKNIGEIDIELGIKYCMNDEDFYLEVVKSYLENDKRELMDKALEDESFEEYRIQVHALKSISLNIGAKGLSDEAKEIENACKAGDFDKVRRGHDHLQVRYGELLDSLK
ncbi:MAG: DegV family EDD domain-containing protein [Butyrivibrio sp.]|nr:DegV family EDD domain-containing protein [Butyrivibrio sp.]